MPSIGYVTNKDGMSIRNRCYHIQHRHTSTDPHQGEHILNVIGTKDAFLPDIKLPELERIYRKEPLGKSKDRLQAAVMRKKGKSQQSIAKDLGRTQSTISIWLNKMQNKGLASIYDRKIPGRPSILSTKQQKEIGRDLRKRPADFGLGDGVWTGPLLSSHIYNKFGVQYSTASAIALEHRLGFPVKKPGRSPKESPKGSKNMSKKHG